MNIIADLHCHTLASTHAFNTVTEMVQKASELGLYAINISDHGPLMGDAPHIWHFTNLIRQIPEKINGVKVLKGAEVNIINYDGAVDLNDNILKDLDLVIASFHKPVIDGQNEKVITKTMENIANNPYIDIIGHCGMPEFSFDYKKIIELLKENNKLIEINSNTFNIRKNSWNNCIKIAKLCKDIKCKIAVNSDCHSIYSLANIKNAMDMLESINFPKELIVNAQIDTLEEYLTSRKNRMCKLKCTVK